MGEPGFSGPSAGGIPFSKIEKEGLTYCNIEEEQGHIAPFVMVIFGGAGDLARRKLLPTIYSMFVRGSLPDRFDVIAFGRQDLDNEKYRSMVASSIEDSDEVRAAGSEGIGSFLEHLFFSYGHFEKTDHYRNLKLILEERGRKERLDVLYYLSIPSALYGEVIDTIGRSGLPRSSDRTRIVIEKPFGRDLKSALELNGIVERVFREEQVFRMDHYLGKETVQNIIFLRFANSIFEPLWNRNHIDHVQITVAESLGVEHRGRFYEKTGAIRDIFQNHMLQVLSLIAMEPPDSFKARQVRDEKVKVIRSLKPVAYEDVPKVSAAGQYGSGFVDDREVPAYREENSVAPDSRIPTFFAARVDVENWRWAGVPFYLRTGKRLPRRLTEVVIKFKQPPLKMFRDDCRPLDSSSLVLTIQPEEQIVLRMGVKYPESTNLIVPVEMSFNYNDFFDRTFVSSYERLLRDCLAGDQSLFVRQDAVEASWSFADPFVKWWEECDCLEMYGSGSWGPEGSDRFIQRDGRSWESV